MSVNLVLEFEPEFSGLDNAGSFMFERFTTGITSRASVGLDEFLLIGSVRARVTKIEHRWEKPGSEKAPVSWVFAECDDYLTQEQFDELTGLGFHG